MDSAGDTSKDIRQGNVHCWYKLTPHRHQSGDPWIFQVISPNSYRTANLFLCFQSCTCRCPAIFAKTKSVKAIEIFSPILTKQELCVKLYKLSEGTAQLRNSYPWR